jgi:hypothetical protein
MVGVGGQAAKLVVFIANRPPLPTFESLEIFRPLVDGEIAAIAQESGNHWRKIFNCYAKLAYSLDATGENSWQHYRDRRLLQQDSNEQLIFSPPKFTDHNQIHIICGKTYFQSLKLTLKVDWIDPYFAVAQSFPLIVSPYFDYRQLSNQRIDQLVRLIKQFKSA